MTGEISNLPAGSTLQGGKYKVMRVLGQGGFGITYLAVQTGLGMKVAVKEFFLKGSCQRDSSTSEVSVPVTDNKVLVTKCQKKFKSEARKIASLNNDHIVNIIDIFDENGTSYYVMKYLSGGSLAEKVSKGPMTEQEALTVIHEVADALDSIHSHGLLHLDIKPANILFDERGRAVLIDFGVSKYVDSQDDTTTTSSLVGFSRGFAPLEQVNATISSLTPATDLYALGATLFNLVVGTVPPDASSVMDNGLPAMPAGVSNDVQNAVVRSMQPKKKDRPQNVQSFLELLPTETLPPQEDEVTVVVPPADSGVSPAPHSGKTWQIVSAFLLCMTLFLGTAFLKQRNGTAGNVRSLDINTLTRANEDLKKNNEALQKQVSSLQGKEASLTQNNGSLQKQVNELKGQVSTQGSRINSLEKDNASLKKQIEEYKPKAERWDRLIKSQ